jgi:hypothetical protein
MSQLPQVANPQQKLYPSDLSDAEWQIIRDIPVLTATEKWLIFTEAFTKYPLDTLK